MVPLRQLKGVGREAILQTRHWVELGLSSDPSVEGWPQGLTIWQGSAFQGATTVTVHSSNNQSLADLNNYAQIYLTDFCFYEETNF